MNVSDQCRPFGTVPSYRRILLGTEYKLATEISERDRSIPSSYSDIDGLVHVGFLQERELLLLLLGMAYGKSVAYWGRDRWVQHS